MTIRKSLTAILAAGMLLSQSVRAAAGAPIQDAQKQILSQQALQYNQYYNAAGIANPKVIAPMAAGLLYEHTSFIRAGAGGVYLTSRTGSFSSMKKIGLKNVYLQYSRDNANWSDVRYVGTFLNSNSTFHAFTNKFITASNGAGYYRVKLTHTAYNNPFDPHDFEQYTNSVWLYY